MSLNTIRRLIKQKIIVIVGPTTSGKSDLALRFAKLAQGKVFKEYGISGAEIISADSRQVYRGMDIGTGKIKKDRYKGHLCITKMPFVSYGIRHYLLDVANPKKQFTANNFKKLGIKAIKEIISKNKIPIIVGGAGFYIDVLLDRIIVAEVLPNKNLRIKLDKFSTDNLYNKLKKLDPDRAKIIDRHNKRRLIRALEIIITTKKTSLNTRYKIQDTKYNTLWLGLKPKKMEKRIKLRLDKRLKQGMIKEVKRLHAQGVSWKRLDDFGLEYRWISRWLIKNLKLKIKNYNSKFKSSEEYQNLFRDIIKYSKRQMTWFKRNKEINWFTLNEVEGIKDYKTAEQLVLKWLKD